MDGSTRAEIQRRVERSEVVSYQEIWNWMVGKFGGDTQSAIRSELATLRPQHEGRLTLAAWYAFEGEFKLLFGRLECPVEDEAWSALMGKIPDSFRCKIMGEQERRNQRSPALRLTGLQGMSLETLRQAVSQIPGLETGVTVTQQGDHFLMRLGSASQVDAALAINGRRLTGSQTPTFILS